MCNLYTKKSAAEIADHFRAQLPIAFNAGPGEVYPGGARRRRSSTTMLGAGLRHTAFPLLGLLVACGARATDQPVDGGLPLDISRISAEDERAKAADPCWRREGRGWHWSITHCREMLPAERMSGVWVTGFEESSFFPGARAIPDRNDGRRYYLTLEVDGERVQELARQRFQGGEYRAFALTFIGRRTKYPTSIDCYGGRDHSFVVDRLESAHYLGIMANPEPPPLPSARAPWRPFPRSGEGGDIARLETEALARCGGSASGT